MHPIVIIGAGMTGLMAGNDLIRSGIPVVILEKSRGVGGRMATRRFAGGVFDHGVNDFIIRNAKLREFIHDWKARELLTVWFSSDIQSGTQEPEHHYRGIRGMTAVPKYLAGTLPIERTTRVVSLKRADDRWIVLSETNKCYPCTAVLFTPPIPQIVYLLEKAGISADTEVGAQIREIMYEPTLMLLARAPNALPLSGAGIISPDSDAILKITDNTIKGITETRGCFTVQCSRVFSTDAIQRSDEEIFKELRPIVEDELGAEIEKHQVHRWRYGRPLNPPGIPYLEAAPDSNVFIAGDGLAGASVEAAMSSGIVAADIIRSRIGFP